MVVEGIQECRTPYVPRGVRMSLIAVVQQSGLVTYRIQPGAANGLDFAEFILFQVVPIMPQGTVLVWDNYSTHRGVFLRQMLQFLGVSVCPRPGYSPYLNLA